jgi:hypothetical protein
MEYQELIELSTQHPIMREYYSIDSKEDYLLLKELPMMLLKNLNRLIMSENKT